MIKALLESEPGVVSAQLTVTDPDTGASLFQLAVQHGRRSVIRLLQQLGLRIEPSEVWAKAGLAQQAASGDLDFVRLLLTAGMSHTLCMPVYA